LQDAITPEFINPADPDLLEAAEQLLTIFKSAEGKTRSELSEESKPVIEGAPFEAVIARGLEKLLLDRTDFDTAPDEDLPLPARYSPGNRWRVTRHTRNGLNRNFKKHRRKFPTPSIPISRRTRKSSALSRSRRKGYSTATTPPRFRVC